MSSSSTPDLIKISEIFLVPSTFMVAALGTADTNLHRAAVSIVGLVVTILWWIAARNAFAEVAAAPAGGTASPRRMRVLSTLPIVFLVGWAISTVAHLMLWNRPLGG